MNTRSASFTGVVLILLLLAAFAAGRVVGLRERVQVPGSEIVSESVHPNEIRTSLNYHLDEDAMATGSFQQLYGELRAGPERRRDYVREFDKMPPGPRRSAAVTNFFKLVTQLDVLESMELFCLIRGQDLQNAAFEALTTALTSSEIPQFLMSLEKLSPEFQAKVKEKYLNEMLAGWSCDDPAAVARYVEDHIDEGIDFTASHLIRSWAAVDPEAAKAWVFKHASTDSASMLNDDLIQGWYFSDPSAAEDYALAHGSDEQFEKAIGHLGFGLFIESPASAKAFFDKLSDPRLEKAVLAEIANINVEMFAPDPANHTSKTKEVLDWLVQFPAEDWKGSLRWLVTDWRKADLGGLLVWMNSLPATTRDAIATDYTFNGEESSEDLIRPLFDFANLPVRDVILRNFANIFPGPKDERVKIISELNLPAEEKEYLVTLVETAEPAGNVAPPYPQPAISTPQ